MLNTRMGPPKCPYCGNYGYNHDCPFQPCRKSAYIEFWRKFTKTFGLPQPEPQKCNCMKCKIEQWKEELKAAAESVRKDG